MSAASSVVNLFRPNSASAAAAATSSFKQEPRTDDDGDDAAAAEDASLDLSLAVATPSALANSRRPSLFLTTPATVAQHSPQPQPQPQTHLQQQQQVHICKLCDKLLSSSSSLDRHMLTHSGERPFVCKRCQMTFTTNGNMHRHMRTHLHKDSIEVHGKRLEQRAAKLARLNGAPAGVGAAPVDSPLPRKKAVRNLSNASSVGQPQPQPTSTTAPSKSQRSRRGSRRSPQPATAASAIATAAPGALLSPLDALMLVRHATSAAAHSTTTATSPSNDVDWALALFESMARQRAGVGPGAAPVDGGGGEPPESLGAAMLAAAAAAAAAAAVAASSNNNEPTTTTTADDSNAAEFQPQLQPTNYCIKKATHKGSNSSSSSARSSCFVATSSSTSGGSRNSSNSGGSRHNFEAFIDESIAAQHQSALQATSSSETTATTNTPQRGCGRRKQQKFARSNIFQFGATSASDNSTANTDDDTDDVRPNMLVDDDNQNTDHNRNDDDSDDNDCDSDVEVNIEDADWTALRASAYLKPASSDGNNNLSHNKHNQPDSNNNNNDAILRHFDTHNAVDDEDNDDGERQQVRRDVFFNATNNNCASPPATVFTAAAATPTDFQRTLKRESKQSCASPQSQSPKPTPCTPTPSIDAHGRTSVTDGGGEEIIEDFSESYVKTANPNATQKGSKRNRHCYRCKLCTYSSVDRCTLVRHLRIHSGERPYICGICRYAFTTKANCERHVRKRHKKQYNSLGGASTGAKGGNGGGRSLIITDHSNHQTIPHKVNPIAARNISQALLRVQEQQQQQQQAECSSPVNLERIPRSFAGAAAAPASSSSPVSPQLPPSMLPIPTQPLPQTLPTAPQLYQQQPLPTTHLDITPPNYAPNFDAGNPVNLSKKPLNADDVKLALTMLFLCNNP